MRNIYECNAEVSLHLLELDLHLLTHLEVERAERLVEEQDARTVDDGSCYGNSLHLTAGQLVDVSLAVIREADLRQGCVYSLLDLLLGDLLDLQAECDIIENIQMREQGIPLEHRVDVPLVCRHLQEVFAFEIDYARISSLESRDDPERRRLTAAGRSEQRNELIISNIKSNILKYLCAVKALAQVLDLYDVLSAGIVRKDLIVCHLYAPVRIVLISETRG